MNRQEIPPSADSTDENLIPSSDKRCVQRLVHNKAYLE